MAKTKKRNSFGVMLLKFILILILGIIALSFILPPLFSIIAPFLHALPFDAPRNYIITDYIGMTVLGLASLTLLFFAFKWGFR
ncbi:MAG: hypothetical protein OEW60_04390 [Thiovulaceae bacterium]|nr:hypothetical protein [Sulfurimonadaceae bacterium]